MARLDKSVLVSSYHSQRHPTLPFWVVPVLGFVVGKRGECIGGIQTNGYVQVGQRKGKRLRFHLVHRLVWEGVHGKIPKGMEVHHRNGVKADNRIQNLELVTHSENLLAHFAGRLKVTSMQAQQVLQNIGLTTDLEEAERYGATEGAIKALRS